MSIITLEKVSKYYGNRVIFEDFDLNIDEGEFIFITGESGSGKSTLLNMIGLLEQPSRGEIKIKGYINPTINSKTGIQLLRNEISYLFQEYGLIENETVKYNLQIAEKFKKINGKEKNKEMLEALEAVGLGNILNEKIYKLSGGEQQRVALAKCILKPSDIILADEPTGSLDKKNKIVVMEILKKLHNSGKTIVMVSHDETIKHFATRSIQLIKKN